MKDVIVGNFSVSGWQFWPPQTIRVVDWNIDRGLRLSEITDFLKSQQTDILTLQEVDLNARRTNCLNIAEELARRLKMNFVFGREFQELTQGSPASPAYHGRATLSRWRLKNPRVIRFRRQSGFWRPRWYLPHTEPFQERLGGRIALAVDVEAPGRSLAVYNLHLESRGDDDLRLSQLKEVLDDATKYGPRVPILVAGDLNLDASEAHAAVLLRQTGFRSVFGQSRFYTRPARNLFWDARSIDWGVCIRPGQCNARTGPRKGQWLRPLPNLVHVATSLSSRPR